MNLNEPRPGPSLVRRAGIAGLVVLAVALAWVIATGGGSTPDAATATASPAVGAASAPAFSDLPLVAVSPIATPVSTAAATSPSLSPEPSAPSEVRAKRIRIDRVGIDLAIVEGDGVDTPIGKAAHYPGTAWPDGGSNIYLYGHARVGMFIALWKTHVGDTVELDLADGSTRTYVVTKILPKVRWDAMEYLDPTGTEQLTLQTCTSNYPTAPRFIVIAVPAT